MCSRSRSSSDAGPADPRPNRRSIRSTVRSSSRHSRPWISRIDVPTAVVVNTKDKVIPAERQVRLARSIPGATIHDVKAGHAACVLSAERFVPALIEATLTVNARRRDFQRRNRSA